MRDRFDILKLSYALILLINKMQKYQIISVIGEGAYGVVLKCRSNETKQFLAIKKFKESEDDQLVRKVTMREVKILKNMKNPNIVELRDAFRRKGIVYLVFEYVQNNLLEVLEKSPDGLQPQLIKNIIYQLIKGLAYMHSNNIIHRDIKPQNLLISENNELKICDFGFARTYKKPSEEYTDYVATRWYRPPQLLVGAPYDSSIDIWAVGCIMAELIDGNPLFPGQNEFDQLFLIQKSLGSLTSDHFQTFLKNPRFIGMKFPQITSLDTIQKRYLGKLSQKALNFLKSTLKINPSERIGAVEALNHSYFDNIRQSDILRRYSAGNNYKKTENKAQNMKKQEYPNSVSYQRKKIQTNPYNPPVINSNLERERQRTEEISHEERLFHTRGGGKFYQQGNPNPYEKMNKESKEDIRNFQLTSKGFHPIHSKSVNKTNHPGQAINNPTKMSKLKEKYISLQKGYELKNRDNVIKTQAGFYKNKPIRIDLQEYEETEHSKIKKLRGINNNKFHQQNTEDNNHPHSKSRNTNNRSIINTEQISEEDEGKFSSSQLPFLMVSSQQTQPSIPKYSQGQIVSSNNQMLNKQHKKQRHKASNHTSMQPQPNLNIIISNSVFNGYQYHQQNHSTNKNY